MQNYLLVLTTLTLKSFFVHIRDYLSTSSFAIFASLAGDVLCRILGVVGVMGKQCYFQYIKILVS